MSEIPKITALICALNEEENLRHVLPRIPDWVDEVLDYFNGWLPSAHRVYEQPILRDKEQGEERQRKELERQVAEQEARQRVLRSIKLTKDTSQCPRISAAVSRS